MKVTIKGEGMVFANDRGDWTSYTMGVSSKKQEGGYANAYQLIRFRKGEGVPNKTKIAFEAFPTVNEFTTKEGQKRSVVVWQILNYRLAAEEMPNRPPEGFSALSPDEMPF